MTEPHSEFVRADTLEQLPVTDRACVLCERETDGRWYVDLQTGLVACVACDPFMTEAGAEAA
jgi:hypothetical protein